ncbi:DUF4258 domain-containing protein [Candidatus Woesearchaeota archaeon]|nr:DUF4258 domain-containing protein [Candidatus Woesearchaeota archaeon]
MEIIYTIHARQQIKERKVEQIWVDETIKSPDITQQNGYKYYAVKKLNGKTLKVVFVREKYIKVITAYFIK